MLDLIRFDGKGDNRRRNRHILKGSGHTVFTPNGRNAKGLLGFKGAQKRRKGLAPFFRVFVQTLKVFLEAQTGFSEIAPHGHHFR